MKSYKHLFEELLDETNIKLAMLNASKGKRDRKDVQEILNNYEEHVKIIKQMLIEGTFKPKYHKPLLIKDKGSKKVRKIICPDFAYEQIIHHLIILVLEPKFRERFYKFSCSSIFRRGGRYGKKYLEKFIYKNRNNKLYVLKFDICKFFDSISRPVLYEKLKKYIKDEKFLSLLHKIIFYDLSLTGIPLGYFTSQWLSNFYLTEMDFYIKHTLKIKGYFRYADDCVLVDTNKNKLHRALTKLRKYLKTQKLRIKDDWQIFRFSYVASDGVERGRFIDFMGFKFYHNRTTIRKRILYNIRKRCNKLYKKWKYKKYINWFNSCQIISQLGWFKDTDSYTYFLNYIKPKVKFNKCKRLIRKHYKECSTKQFIVKSCFL